MIKKIFSQNCKYNTKYTKNCACQIALYKEISPHPIYLYRVRFLILKNNPKSLQQDLGFSKKYFYNSVKIENPKFSAIINNFSIDAKIVYPILALTQKIFYINPKDKYPYLEFIKKIFLINPKEDFSFLGYSKILTIVRIVNNFWIVRKIILVRIFKIFRIVGIVRIVGIIRDLKYILLNWLQKIAKNFLILEKKKNHKRRDLK
ncbi:MAG: hypothetical protein ACTSRP_02165 [Candidatus Helarchaeota archaeon]